MLACSDELKVPGAVPVWATAIVYFKRFYLTNSMMDFNPKFVMVTALNLALKAEEQRHITLQAVADITSINVNVHCVVGVLLVLRLFAFSLLMWNVWLGCFLGRAIGEMGSARVRGHQVPFIDISPFPQPVWTFRCS